MSGFRIKHYDGHGELLKARVLPNAEAVANELHDDYRASVLQECEWAALRQATAAIDRGECRYGTQLQKDTKDGGTDGE